MQNRPIKKLWRWPDNENRPTLKSRWSDQKYPTQNLSANVQHSKQAQIEKKCRPDTRNGPAKNQWEKKKSLQLRKGKD